MRKVAHKKILFLAIFVLAGGEFLMDIITPLGVADWVFYFIPLLLSVYVGDRDFPYVLAVLLSSLTLAGYYLSPPGIDPQLAMIGRQTGISTMWILSLVISRRKQAEEVLRQSDRALVTISECNQILVRATSESALLHEVCRVIVEKGGYRMAWVGFPGNDEQKSVRVAARARPMDRGRLTH